MTLLLEAWVADFEWTISGKIALSPVSSALTAFLGLHLRRFPCISRFIAGNSTKSSQILLDTNENTIRYYCK